MTAVLDPYGTPSIVYTRSGVSIQEFVSPGGSAIATTSPSGVSHFVVNATGAHTSSEGVILPSNAEIGDVVYVYNVSSAWQFSVIAPTGETISGYPDYTLSPNTGTTVVKYSATAWAIGAR